MEQLSALKPSVLNGARILLVEDDFILMSELQSIVSDAGGDIVGLCYTASDALALARKDDIDAAVLDFQLGRETSTAAAQELARRGIPFMFYTGQNAELCSKWPNRKIVAKPAHARILVAAVADLLRR